MQTTNNTWRSAVLAALMLLASAPAARAVAPSDGDAAARPREAAATDAPPAAGATPSTPAPIEEQLRRQGEMLEQMQQLLLKQQAEIDRLRSELDGVRANGAASAAAPAVATSAGAATAPATPVAAAAGPATQDAGDLGKRIEAVEKRFGAFTFSGDLRLRYEGQYNQGFDLPLDVDARNRARMRLRLQLTNKIDNHFDWGLRLASGSFDDPTSTNQTITSFFDRKPIGIDRAYIHFTTDAKPANLDVYVGKFDFTWKRTSLTFDPDVQPEGASERLKFAVPGDSVLKSVTLTAWQLPILERSIGADATIFGGQILTDWKWSKNWTSSLSGSFHDFEQANVIPPNVLVSPTLVNAGLEIGTTNNVFLNPFTNQLQYRSKFRAFDIIGDVTYRGFGEKLPLTILGEWLHNTSAFNNQKDGGLGHIEIGRKKEEGDFFAEYNFWKAERDVFPSVFMESDVGIQTNSVAHWFSASYNVRRNVLFQTNYFLTRRLQRLAFNTDNRWLNRFQLDMIYSF